MRNDYRVEGPTTKIEVEVEVEISNQLEQMSAYTQLTQSELVNTAIRRFVSAHKDFFPQDEADSQKSGTFN